LVKNPKLRRPESRPLPKRFFAFFIVAQNPKIRRKNIQGVSSSIPTERPKSENPNVPSPRQNSNAEPAQVLFETSLFV
jgi:hypothetical protein